MQTLSSPSDAIGAGQLIEGDGQRAASWDGTCLYRQKRAPRTKCRTGFAVDPCCTSSATNDDQRPAHFRRSLFSPSPSPPARHRGPRLPARRSVRSVHGASPHRDSCCTSQLVLNIHTYSSLCPTLSPYRHGPCPVLLYPSVTSVQSRARSGPLTCMSVPVVRPSPTVDSHFPSEDGLLLLSQY